MQIATASKTQFQEVHVLLPVSRTMLSAAHFLLLAAQVKRFLSAPPTSVVNEHLFSSAAKMAYMDHCNRLLPKHVNCQHVATVFLKHNLPFINVKC